MRLLYCTRRSTGRPPNPDRASVRAFGLGWIVAGVLLGTWGCDPEPEAPDRPLQGVRVTMLGVDGTRIGGLALTYADDWGRRTGAQVDPTTVPADKLGATLDAARSQAPADVIICPVDWSGDLLGRGLASRLPDWLTRTPTMGQTQTWRDRAADALDWADVLPRARDRLGAWGRHAAAIPYSGQVLLCYYREDLFSDPAHQKAFKQATGSDLRVPTTWAAYERVARYFHEAGAAGRGPVRFGTTEPGTGLLTDVFFAHGAALMYDPEHLSFEFDLGTMQPRIALAGFVAGLERMVAIRRVSPGYLPVAKHRKEFLAGRAAMALDTLELAVLAANPELSKVAGRTGYALMPGSRRVFDPGQGRLVTRDTANRVLVVPGGPWGAWVAVVGAPDARRDAAFALGAYLCGKEVSRLGVTDGVTLAGPFRQSHVARASAWVELGFDAAGADALTKAVAEAGCYPNVLVPLRMPGCRQYRASLEQAIESALAGRQPAAKALSDVAATWQAVTDKLGKDAQRNAYRQSLGLSARE